MLTYACELFILLTMAICVRGADDVLTLRDALTRTLYLSPELATLPYDERAAEARVLQAGLRPNPEVSVEVEDFGGQKEFRGFGESETTLKFGQLLELGGKRAARIREAQAEKALVKFDCEVKRREVLESDGPGVLRRPWSTEARAVERSACKICRGIGAGNSKAG